MILVTAAAGRTGRHLISALQARDLPVRALVRRPQPDPALPGDVELVVGDLLDKDTLRRACDRCAAIIHTGPAGADEPVMGKWIVDAAKAAGVGHFIYNSVTHPQTEWLLNHRNKLKVEDHLINSGLPFTILQPMHYFQNIDVRRAVERGAYVSAYSPTVGLSFVDMADVAEVAARIVGDPAHFHATYEICASDHLTSAEVASLIAARSGAAIRNEQLGIAEFVAGIPGTDGYFGDFLIRLMTYYNRYGIRGNANVLTWLLGRAPTNATQYVDRMLGMTV